MKKFSRIWIRSHSLFLGLAALSHVRVITVGLLVYGSLGELHAADSADPIYQLNEVDKPPVIKREMRLRFARGLRKDRDQITLRFVVTASGKTTRITVVKFTDPEMIDRALAAYESADYTPAQKNGKPVAAWLEVTETAK